MNWLSPAIMALSVPAAMSVAIALVLQRVIHDCVSSIGRDDPELADLRLSGAEAHAWATAHGFAFAGYYRAQSGGRMLVWERSGRAELLVMYRIGEAHHYDLVTSYEGNRALTTASARGLFPIRPGAYTQYFPQRTFDQRWELHCQADEYLRTAGRLALAGIVPEFGDDFVRSNRRSAIWVRMQPLWHARVPYWFFVRRFVRCNVTVAEQHRRGWVRLPHEFTRRDLARMERLAAKCAKYEAAASAAPP